MSIESGEIVCYSSSSSEHNGDNDNEELTPKQIIFDDSPVFDYLDNKSFEISGNSIEIISQSDDSHKSNTPANIDKNNMIDLIDRATANLEKRKQKNVPLKKTFRMKRLKTPKDSNKLQNQSNHKKEKVPNITQKFKRMLNKRPISKKSIEHCFTFPTTGSIIVIRCEDLNNKMGRKSYTLLGKVEEVISVQSTYTTIKATYLKTSDKVNILERTEDLFYREYGYFKTWYIKYDDSDQSNAMNVIMQNLESKDRKRVTINTELEPLVYNKKYLRKPIDHELKCEKCKSADADHAIHGKMLVCDVCNHGYHQNCLNTPIITIPKDEWICELCT
jgi:hypothetical protein